MYTHNSLVFKPNQLNVHLAKQPLSDLFAVLMYLENCTP
jgi:hypothetical protein